MTLADSARRALHQHLFAKPLPHATLLYRYEHSLRVAAIGRHVAQAENLDPDVLELACLLHDIGKFDGTVPVDHGRAGAILARPILERLGLSSETVTEICQGIAMHTDGRWNYDPQSPDYPGYDLFDSEPSVLSRSVGDCDNVDRYSLLRIHGTMNWVGVADMEASEALAWIEQYRTHLATERSYRCATETAQALWLSALNDHDTFFARLADQLRPAVALTD